VTTPEVGIPSDTSMPVAPQVSVDPLLETLPGAIVDSRESPCVMRIGVVTQIIEGSQITVKISGSDVLVDCSYLFFQYFPLLGDRVIILKQDSQWACLGQLSGAIGSNTPLPNSSFEDGAIATIPTGWTINVISSVAGVPSFLVASPSSVNISGMQIADFGVDSVVAGQSIADVFSPIVPASPDTAWTAAYYLTRIFVDSIPPDFSDLEMWIQFLDPGSTVISEYMVNAFSISADSLAPVYRRINLNDFPAGKVTAPAGTVAARIRFRGTFNLPATSFVSFFIDNVILRQVD
jgi:hypothetical protein